MPTAQLVATLVYYPWGHSEDRWLYRETFVQI